MVVYLTRAEIIETNRRLLQATGGGLFGLRDAHRIDYIVGIVEDDRHFPRIFDKAAFYLHRIAQSQAFVDGNKRTALLAADSFLDLNGYTFRPPGAAWTVRYMVEIAEARKNQRQVKQWLRRHSIIKPR